jgi:hypothetical protein
MRSELKASVNNALLGASEPLYVELIHADPEGEGLELW